MCNSQWAILRPRWISDCDSFAGCKIRSHCRTNSKNDSIEFAARIIRPIRIEHWELNIGQIPIGHSAKLFLRKPLEPRN